MRRLLSLAAATRRRARRAHSLRRARLTPDAVPLRQLIVPERGAWLIAVPMKIGGGSGGPLRAVAVIPK